MEVDGICWLRHKGQEVVRVYFILNRKIIEEGCKMYMKNYKTLYKIITLSLVFGGCLYNYNMYNVYASDLNIVDEKGDNYLVNSGGTFKFLDGANDYDKISYTKHNGVASGINFMNINNKKVEVLT